ncbi:hypothetical protein [Streptomyces roseolilacinus]|uniref:Uncharacterized protein n=1 Tax=Streptomyces roseolilacinus TaxID=66904 RepID=A0A918B5H3_9ACTN|nr:hypothetical protein [Streptomyces roseolilacinus]GGQ16477.1 hypothetical protein GCM10010249_38980 [Streptomyces roseolilacinus]
MEGLRLIRIARPARIVRPMALVSAVATLLAALLLCSGPAGHSGRDGHAGPGGAARDGHASARAVADPLPFDPAAATASRFGCPYDDRDCDLFPPLTPAVLTVPPPDPPSHADGLAPFAPAPGAVRPDGPRAPPRAPDLHVLQVLRT